MPKLLIEDYFSKTFIKFEELYNEEIIHQDLFVKFCMHFTPQLISRKSNSLFILVFGRVSSAWRCFQSLEVCLFFFDN